MPRVTSRDGTEIGYERKGAGPPVVLIGGATQFRAIDRGTARIADMLAAHFSVIVHDRRGRGESGDTAPYAVAREVEDIAALIAAAGGRAALYGMSSGAVLAIEAASALPEAVTRLIGYEPPVDVDQTRETAWANVAEMEGFAARGDGGGACAAFMALVGMPPEAIERMRGSKTWPAFASVGHTIAYDLRIIAEATDGGLPARWRKAVMPALIIDGDESHDFMGPGADAVALPNAQRRTLAGQGHDVDPEALVPVMIEFLEA